jgi:hypothetical protein
MVRRASRDSAFRATIDSETGRARATTRASAPYKPAVRLWANPITKAPRAI